MKFFLTEKNFEEWGFPSLLSDLNMIEHLMESKGFDLNFFLCRLRMFNSFKKMKENIPPKRMKGLRG